MLILGLILFGMVVGAGAQLILGKSAKGVDWTLALVAGLVGSFIGGLLISLLSGDGLQFRPSGIIGSLVGALLVTAGWQWYRCRQPRPPTPEGPTGSLFAQSFQVMILSVAERPERSTTVIKLVVVSTYVVLTHSIEPIVSRPQAIGLPASPG